MIDPTYVYACMYVYVGMMCAPLCANALNSMHVYNTYIHTYIHTYMQGSFQRKESDFNGPLTVFNGQQRVSICTCVCVCVCARVRACVCTCNYTTIFTCISISEKIERSQQ